MLTQYACCGLGLWLWLQLCNRAGEDWIQDSDETYLLGSFAVVTTPIAEPKERWKDKWTRSEERESRIPLVMENTTWSRDHVEEEEYVLLDLDGVLGLVDIPPAAPFVLSGLDTLNPVLIIDNKLKLVGEYKETIGTCLVFSESDANPAVHEESETGSSNANSSSGECISGQTPAKQVKPIACLHKTLKFRLLEVNCEDATAKQANT